MGCTQSNGTGLLLDKEDIKDCDASPEECVAESRKAAQKMQEAGVLNATGCTADMTWDLLHAWRSVCITRPEMQRYLCLVVVSRTNVVALGVPRKYGCCNTTTMQSEFGSICQIKEIKCSQPQILEIIFEAPPPTEGSVASPPRMATKMMLQRPDVTSMTTALRVSLAHAYYGTPPFMIPFKITLLKDMLESLPPFDQAVHQAGGLRSVFLAMWSADPRSINADSVAMALATKKRIESSDFTMGAQLRHGLIDVGHVAGGAPASVIALVRALRFNTFFGHLDLSYINATCHVLWNPFGPALQITTWDLTECGISDEDLLSLLPAWWRIFTLIAPVRVLQLGGNYLGAPGLVSLFDMLNGNGYTFAAPVGFNLPPGPLPAPNKSFLTCLELGRCDLTGTYIALALLLSRCPFLRKLDMSIDPDISVKSSSFGNEECTAVFDGLVDGLCPLEELDMRGLWSWSLHNNDVSFMALKGLIYRKPTMSCLRLGDYTGHICHHLLELARSTAGTKSPGDTPPALVLHLNAVVPRPTAVLQLSSFYTPLPGYILQAHEKDALAVALGNAIASSALQALIMRGQVDGHGNNALGSSLAAMFQALGLSKSLLELDVTGHRMGDIGVLALGTALRQNRSINTLSYDQNDTTLEGFKAIRGCLYGNKKLVNVSTPNLDLQARTDHLNTKVSEGVANMHVIKRRIKVAYKSNRDEFHRQIALVSANNKEWKAYDREKNKTAEVVAVITQCIVDNRVLKDAKDAERSAGKMSRQKEAYEQRYAVKMGKIVTKLSTETDKARVHAASVKTSPFKAQPAKFYYSRNAHKRKAWETNNINNRRRNTYTDGGLNGMYFVSCSPTLSPYNNYPREDGVDAPADERSPDGANPDGEVVDGQGSASISPEGDLVDVQDDYMIGPDDSPEMGDSSNPLDSIRDMITEGGADIFSPAKLDRMDDLVREAGGDAYEHIGPILGQAQTFASTMADTAMSWGVDAGNVAGGIASSFGDIMFGGIGDIFSDVGDALSGAVDTVGDFAGDVLDSAGDLADDARDAVGGLVEDAGELAGDAVEMAECVVEDIGDAAGDAVNEAGDAGRGIADAAGDMAGDAAEAVDDLTGKDAQDDVDMYAGAGPMDLDDGGPTGGGASGKVLSGSRHVVERHSQPESDAHSCVGIDRPCAGVGELTALRVQQREHKRRQEGMIEAAKKVARPEAIPYKMNLHAFRAGRPSPSPKCPVTLVTQCSADRLPSVLKQALKWGGDISLAVLVPSAPSSATTQTLRAIREVCDAVDEAWSYEPSQEHLSLDVAVLEGAEVDQARHDHCGSLFPVNALRNLALLQARDDEVHPAKAVFLVDSDCVPSEQLLSELSLPEVQDSVCGKEITDSESGGMSPVAVVVPCLEFYPSPDGREKNDNPPSTVEEAVEMLWKGQVQGFHVDYFFKGHGPTDFDRWSGAATKTGKALAYTVPFGSCFEPYVVVAKAMVPMYDERFRGYGMNKVAHILSLATGSAATNSLVKPAEFAILRKAFIFALSHSRSEDWETTYGRRGDPLRRYQVKVLWSTFQDEVSQGIPPVVCSSTAKIANTLLKRRTQQTVPPYRVHQSLPAVEDGDFMTKLPKDMIKNNVLVLAERTTNVALLPPTKLSTILLPLAQEDLPPKPPLTDVKTSVVAMEPASFVCRQGHVVACGMHGSEIGSYVLPLSKEE